MATDYSHIEQRLPIVENLAAKALDMAVDASPTKPREGEFVRSLMVAVPIANLLLGREPKGDPAMATQAIVQAAEANDPKIVDGRGHARLAYHYLLFDLILSADYFQAIASELSIYGAIRPPLSDGQPHHDALLEMCESGYMAALVNGGYFIREPKPFHAQTMDDAPDAWVYREMVGLHATFNQAFRQSPDFYGAAHDVARYHLQHTQPDYTTYQPWALAAFLYFPDTVGFAEQQLHDVETHLHVEGPPGALVPGLLLADAVVTLREAMKREA
ncbi:MAG: hypothetical protein AAGF84_11045 [Planctomycetota bacterium]